MKTHAREIQIYYNPESSTHRMTVAHARSLVPHLKTYAFGQTPSNGTSWQQILYAIGQDPKHLLNKAHPYYQQHIRGREFEEACWVKIFQKNPDLIKAPIAMRGHRAIMCLTPTDIYKLTTTTTTPVT